MQPQRVLFTVRSERRGLHRFQPSAALLTRRTADVLPSIAEHRAVKPSCVDKLELLDPLCEDPSPTLGRMGE